MTSAIFYKDNHIWGTNGSIEEILIKLIKYSPDDSRLLQWALEHYRESFPGICCDLTEVLSDSEAVSQWQATIRTALEDLRKTGGWTDSGNRWIDEHFEALVHLADEQPYSSEAAS